MISQDKMDMALSVLSLALGIFGIWEASTGNYAHATYLMASAVWVKP